MTHLDHLLEVVPDLKGRRILDLGSGRGKFLVEAVSRGFQAVGLELNQSYIDISLALAKEKGVSISVTKGMGEKLPYENESFDFINMAEVLEHVEDPKTVMLEVFRILKIKSMVYISVPNRFGLKDQHFNLYFVNWLPRIFSHAFITLFAKHKEYTKEAGFQKLSEMHYYRYSQAVRLFKSSGFRVSDIREKKIKMRFKNVFSGVVIMIAYRIIRIFYFDSFHFLLIKP
jgi:2-polyprenyl-3-methyl-5-hydroxy-6-metoxy-1,4-benzoquinol methylase